ncbi:hypothetical protein Cgig2_023157 [Carnegiea gigantea]|uniref:Uncharacterized protein n=1 Tax=Carnegiea gigantea TaxID=171969 RepID=A0A9Q1KDY8_9CARY|nr:hypothetical protein Cgig2_023157 [Carnegiea gigantea]
MSCGRDAKNDCHLGGERGVLLLEKSPLEVESQGKKKFPYQHSSSPYEEALLSNPSGDGLEGQKSANEIVEEDVREDLSDNSKTISQTLKNAHSRPNYFGKFPSQVPSCESSMEDDKEIDNSLRPFNDLLEMELQLYEKSERCKLASKSKKRGSKNSKCNLLAALGNPIINGIT